ncbi:hypothetical protein [Brockia lithotrophica]|uniref:Uncharacterized protein n=1 Tax=Brockia lithotrophica TaxID=933949 RepID=A0A660L3C2_9BACL|nr:hypothetical protein [Brockia lithotrophica]RKQ88437.1 hypothetical protein C7438_0070 [Brockia lithotrophica]
MQRGVWTYLNEATIRLYVDAHLFPKWVKARVGSMLRNDRGGVSLEWVALGFLVLAVLFAIASAFSNNGEIKNGLATSVKDALSALFGSVANKAKSLDGTGAGGQ